MNKKRTSRLHSPSAPDLNRARRIKGQVEAIERMIVERRYCPEILTQIQAVSSALQALQVNILGTHLNHCVKAAMEAGNASEVKKKVEEIEELLKKK